VSEYQIVPYTFSVHVSGNPSELLALNNIDGAGLKVLDFIAETARAHSGSPRLEKADSSTSLEILQIAKSEHVVALTIGSGQRGVVATLHQNRNGKRSSTDVVEDDLTSVKVRYVFFAPPGSKKGICLIERVAQVGAVTRVGKMLRQSLLAKNDDLLFTLMPAMSPAAIEAWAEKAKVKSIVLRHTHRATGEQTTQLRGIPFTQVLEFRAPRGRSWLSSIFGGKLDESTQKQIITEVVPNIPGLSASDAEAAAAQMMEEGWQVSLGLARDGRRRLVSVAAQTSITMTFPASSKGTAGRPSHEDFVAACQNVLKELNSDGTSVGTPTLCTWTDVSWKFANSAWKAVWGVPESGATSSPT
jgi:hypothetical protein